MRTGRLHVQVKERKKERKYLKLIGSVRGAGPVVLFRVLIPCIMLFEWVTRGSIWRRMQVTRVSELPPVCLLQKTFLLNRMSLCVPIIPRHQAHSCWPDQRSTVWD